MDYLVYVGAGVALVVFELAYFGLARHFQIIDRPNERSSHKDVTLRGGGVIFIVAISFAAFTSDAPSIFVVAGAALVATISFLDDLRPQQALLRVVAQLSGILLMLYSFDLTTWPTWLWVVAVVVCVGALNAFNFMDGINGITGSYALVNIACFLYVDSYVVDFASSNLMIFSLEATLVFLFFNFRKRARCFAGDVGSVTLAFLQIYLLVQLIIVTGAFYWVVFALVFGLDSVITILYRIRKRENIFAPHRTHLYQFLANELSIPQLAVSSCYALIQLTVNVVWITLGVRWPDAWPLFVIITGAAAWFVRLAVQAKIKATTTA